MDRLIKRFDAVPDDDLMVCLRRGIAYQRNMKRGLIAYDQAYFENYQALESSEASAALNEGRLAMLQRNLPAGRAVLDVGVGSGIFLRKAREAGYQAKGIDVNPVALEMLKSQDALHKEGDRYEAVTFWDSLEHMIQPEAGLNLVAEKGLALVALPIMESIQRVRQSKHFKPGEHLYYWTEEGFIAWMAMYGFRLLESSKHEVAAGRESIGAFAFRRDLPTYRDYIAAYAEMHATRHYGSSATELHLDLVSDVVRANNPRSILDFGCGRSDLLAHFYCDGQRRLARYDPAIPRFRDMPEELFDMVLCCDVMEHIPIAYVDKIFAQIKARSDVALFTISIKPARARLPDGSNAHCTLLMRSEWERWIRDEFEAITILPTRAPHEVNVLAGKKARAIRPMKPCLCGGEVFVDSFNPVKRPVEWLVRCRKCGATSPTSSTEQGARDAWNPALVQKPARSA